MAPATAAHFGQVDIEKHRLLVGRDLNAIAAAYKTGRDSKRAPSRLSGLNARRGSSPAPLPLLLLLCGLRHIQLISSDICLDQNTASIPFARNTLILKDGGSMVATSLMAATWCNAMMRLQ